MLHLHGSVVNGVTGKPIPRALVMSGDQRIATMTDGDGHFAVDITLRTNQNNSSGAVFARFFGGGLSLIARKPGFSQMIQPAVIPSDPAAASSNLALKLMPACSIAGQVTAHGEPAGEVNVSLLQRRVEDGQPVWRQRNVQRTNSRGDFHFSELEPGEYTVLTLEWRGDQPQPPQAQQRKAITTQYPPDFAGDTSSVDAATKLHLRYGDAPQVELHLRPATYYPVTIPVAGNASAINVRLSGGGPASFNGFTLGYNNRDHAIEGSLPEGDYTLHLAQYGDPPSFAELPIHVAGGPLEGATVALAPGSTIPVQVEKQFTHSDHPAAQGIVADGNTGGPPPAAQLYLRALDANGQSVNSKRGADGELILDGVPPGQYTVQATAFVGYVASLTSGGVDLRQHPLVVSPGSRPEPIDMVLRDDTGTVTGTLNPGSDTHPLPPYTIIVLIPDGSGAMTTGVAGPDGKFTLANVAPGSYRIFGIPAEAVQQMMAAIDVTSSDAWKGRGASVTVTPGGTSQVDAPLLDPAEVQPE